MEKKYKVYRVSGDDYSALSFEEKFKGKTVLEAVKEVIGEKNSGTFSDDENYFDIALKYETSDRDAFFAQRNEQDYDESKHDKLFIEDEVLKG